MAIGDPYATKEQLRHRFSIPDEDDDERLESAVKAASRAVTKHCRRQFQRTEDASPRRYRRVTPGQLFVDDFYTVEDLLINGTPFDESSYELEPFDGIQDGEPGWPYWRITALSGALPDRVVVSARWGWETVPDSVVEGVLMLAAEVFKMKDAPFGVAGWNEILGQINVRDNPKVKTLLAPYRRGAVRVA